MPEKENRANEALVQGTSRLAIVRKRAVAGEGNGESSSAAAGAARSNISLTPRTGVHEKLPQPPLRNAVVLPTPDGTRKLFSRVSHD